MKDKFLENLKAYGLQNSHQRQCLTKNKFKVFQKVKNFLKYGHIALEKNLFNHPLISISPSKTPESVILFKKLDLLKSL